MKVVRNCYQLLLNGSLQDVKPEAAAKSATGKDASLPGGRCLRRRVTPVIHMSDQLRQHTAGLRDSILAGALRRLNTQLPERPCLAPAILCL